MLQRVAFIFFWLGLIIGIMFSLTAVNRWRIYFTRDQYRQAMFIVTDARYSQSTSTGRNGGSTTITRLLIGSVDGQREQFIPHESTPLSRSRADLLARFPAGTKIPVQYNPQASGTILQSEILRVLEDRPNFWDREARLRRFFTIAAVAPPTITFILYLAARAIGRRNAAGSSI